MSLMTIDNLGKTYRAYRSEWARFGRWFGFGAAAIEENWVLRHVSFQVRPGEAIGIVGQNGAGKSTLLKMITGTMPPTEGKVHVHGRISAILELGMGFNPDLTGRENAWHTSGLMGFGAEQIGSVMDEIEAFAEIGEYFDEPVRIYSSGMQVRLAFAVATAFRPEILIVDEALSVGDAYFQHKSFARIREFQNQGSTLLIVSHDPGSIKTLCNRALLLENGTVVRDGSPEEVLDLYNAMIAEKEEGETIQIESDESGRSRVTSGSGEARVRDIRLLNSKGEASEFFSVGEEVCLEIRVEALEELESLVLGYGVKDRLGQVMFGTNTWHTKQVLETVRAGESYLCSVRFRMDLGVGTYSIHTALTDSDTHLSRNYEWRELALIFNVVNIGLPVFVGSCWMEPRLELERLAG
jgi:lipopolysaccharide transport system ATP-binding protein